MWRRTSLPSPAVTITHSVSNSFINWRQFPHGYAPSTDSASMQATATSTILRSPAATAPEMAVPSAQIEDP